MDVALDIIYAGDGVEAPSPQGRRNTIVEGVRKLAIAFDIQKEVGGVGSRSH